MSLKLTHSGAPLSVQVGQTISVVRDQERNNSMNRKLTVLIVCLLFGNFSQCNNTEQPGNFTASGSIEATTVTLSSKVTGDVVEILQRAGSRVERGALLLRIDPFEYHLQRDQGVARLDQAEAALQLALKGAREEDRQQAARSVDAAKAGLDQVLADYERTKTLQEKGSVTDKQLTDIKSLLDIRQAHYDAAVQAFQKLTRGLRQEEIDMARAGKEQAAAALALLDKKIQDCDIISPLSGIVTEQLLEIGEMVTPGRKACVVADLSTVTLRVYVSEKQLPHVRYGHKVDVRIDGSDQMFNGVISYISDIAEFTPKTIQTQEERVKLVFAVEIELENSKGLLKAGMPADAIFKPRPS